MRKPFSLKARLLSFRHAFHGLKILLLEEHNARIHFAAAVVAVAVGGWRGISSMQWLMVGLAITLVFVTEAINSAIERLSDFACPEWHPTIRKVKDLASFAVLAAAVFAVVVAVVVFGTSRAM